jgi:hypothetical protein
MPFKEVNGILKEPGYRVATLVRSSSVLAGDALEAVAETLVADGAGGDRPHALHGADIGIVRKSGRLDKALGLGKGVGCRLAAALRPVDAPVEAVAGPDRLDEQVRLRAPTEAEPAAMTTAVIQSAAVRTVCGSKSRACGRLLSRGPARLLMRRTAARFIRCVQFWIESVRRALLLRCLAGEPIDSPVLRPPLTGRPA